jgi:signal transduction histidine kinase
VRDDDGVAQLSILLVEDDAVDRLKVQRGLERRGVGPDRLIVAENLARARQWLDRHQPTAAVVDWTLPDGDALDFLDYLERKAIQLPVVVLTGHEDDGRARQALKQGAQDYLTKGAYTLDSLVRSIRYAVERKRAEEYRVRLQHADRLVSLGNLAAGICHEINNPMSWLLANMGFLREQLERLSGGVEPSARPRIEDCLEMIHESETGLQRIAKTASALRDYARLNSERSEAVDVNEVLRTAARIADHEVRHRAEIELELAEDLPRFAGDPAGLQQVFVNLALNAVQAIDAQPEATHRIRLRSERLGGSLLVSIEDSGPGIPRRIRDQVFAPFFTTRSEQQGTGLGLPIAREIITQYGGSLTLEDSGLGGARFQIRLPLGEEPARALDGPAPELTEDLLRGARVLVVDDEPSILRMMIRFLPESDVVPVATVDEAMAVLESSAVEAILCDLNLRPASGADLYREVVSRWPDLVDSFTMTTGGAVTPSLRRFEQEVSIPWLRKPFGRGQVIAAVQRAVTARRRSASAHLPVGT